MALFLFGGIVLRPGPDAVAQTWSRLYDFEATNPADTSQATSVFETQDCGLLVAGWALRGLYGPRALWVLKLDSSGAPDWWRSFGDSGDALASAAHGTANGGVMLAGVLSSSGDEDGWLVRLDGNGQLLWQKAYGKVGTIQRFEALDATPDGGFILAGYDGAGDPGRQIWVVKIGAQGEMLWQKLYSGTTATAIKTLQNGGFIVAGGVQEGYTGPMKLLRLDGDGSVVWQKEYVQAGGTQQARGIRTTLDGGFMLAGYGQYQGQASEGFLLKLDASGGIEWQKSYGEPNRRGPMLFEDVLTTADGGYIAAGSYDDGSLIPNVDLSILRLDSAGHVLWHRTYGRTNETERAWAMISYPDGGYVVAGESNLMIRVLKTTPSGDVSSSCAFQGAVGSVTANVPAFAASSDPTLSVPAVAEVRSVQVPVLTPDSTASVDCIGVPLEVSPPGTTQPLVFVDRETLRWDTAGASASDTFNVYRGETASLPTGDYGACLKSRVRETQYRDHQTPPPGPGWFYLVDGENSNGEGPLGCAGRTGEVRVPTSRCP